MQRERLRERRGLRLVTEPATAKMMSWRPSARGLPHLLSSLFLLLSALSSGCGFSSTARVCGPSSSPDWLSCILDHSPYLPIESDTRKTVYEAPHLLRVRHGRSCVTAAHANANDNIGFRIQDREVVPVDFADSGTVFMNGWDLRYTGGDHHIQGMGSAIANVRSTREGGDFVLSWEAGGVLSDENGDDPYQWCYSYTLVLWTRSSNAFDAIAHDGIGATQSTSSDPGNHTALRALPGSAFHGYGPGVVLPQGFALMWAGGDQHIIQAGFDYGSHFRSAEGQIAWTSRTILKDNDERDDYYGAELVSVLGYASPQPWHPAVVLRETPTGGWSPVNNTVSLTPQASSWFCTGIGNPTREEQYKIENVPFEYAVPVLKGWDLGYLCTDHHVRQMGASIRDFRYERAPDAKTGTLYYTLSLLLNDDSGNLNYGQASVDILGMNALGLGPHPINPSIVNVPSAPPQQPPPASCTLGGMSVADGASITAYASPQSALCEPCESERRVCHHGALSGSFAFATCKARRPGPRQECP